MICSKPPFQPCRVYLLILDYDKATSYRHSQQSQTRRAHDGKKKLSDQGIKILSLHDLYITEDPEETGKTFEENAVLKATYYARLTGIPTIADDGGLMIPLSK